MVIHSQNKIILLFLSLSLCNFKPVLYFTTFESNKKWKNVEKFINNVGRSSEDCNDLQPGVEQRSVQEQSHKSTIY